jgi:hypothetical protein
VVADPFGLTVPLSVAEVGPTFIAEPVTAVGALDAAETTVDFIPVPQPLLDGWFPPSPP